MPPAAFHLLMCMMSARPLRHSQTITSPHWSVLQLAYKACFLLAACGKSTHLSDERRHAVGHSLCGETPSCPCFRDSRTQRRSRQYRRSALLHGVHSRLLILVLVLVASRWLPSETEQGAIHNHALATAWQPSSASQAAAFTGEPDAYTSGSAGPWILHGSNRRSSSVARCQAGAVKSEEDGWREQALDSQPEQGHFFRTSRGLQSCHAGGRRPPLSATLHLQERNRQSQAA